MPGYDKPHVTLAEKVLLNETQVGQKVVIIGAVWWAAKQRWSFPCRERSTIVEMLDDILKVAGHLVVIFGTLAWF